MIVKSNGQYHKALLSLRAKVFGGFKIGKLFLVVRHQTDNFPQVDFVSF